MKKKILFLLSIVVIVIAAVIAINYLFSNTDKKESWESKFIDYDKIHTVTNGENQKIAIIVSGISKFQISDVDKNISLLIDDEKYDLNGHGTMMYSLIKGSETIKGICEKCEILSIKVMSKDESITPEIVSNAIDYAVNQRVSVINFSLGTYSENKLVKNSLKNAIENNIIIVSSSGDYGTEEMLFPANMDDVISVGSINKKGEIWSESNAHNDVDINAPGVDVTVTDIEGKEFLSTGTSQATAIISGYIALMKGKDKDMSIDEIKKNLHDINNKKLSYSDYFIKK